jgi:hypothetical protein
MGEKPLRATKGLTVKEKYLESVVTYTTRPRNSYSVRLCDASPEQLVIIKALFPDYFEKEQEK